MRYSLKIKDETKGKLKIIETYVRRSEGDPERFISIDSLINYLIDYFMQSKGIKYKDLETKTIEGEKNMLKHMRVDINIPKKIRQDMKNIGLGMVQEGMINKKPKFQQLLDILMKDYLQANPQLKKYLRVEEDIQVKVEINKIKKEKYGFNL